MNTEESGHHVTMTWGVGFDVSLASRLTGVALVLFSGISKSILRALSTSTLRPQVPWDHNGETLLDD